LLQAGYTVRITSRSTERPGEASPLEWAQADLRTGAGVAEAVAGVDVLVHAASDPVHSRDVDVLGTEKLLAAAHTTGVGHFVYISIVGIDRVPFIYYKHKLAAEAVIERGKVPWSILRVSQFHSFIDRLLQPLKRVAWVPVFLLPTDFQSQPIDEGEVAERFVELVGAHPGGRQPDIAGPEILRLGDMAKLWLASQGMARPLWRLPILGAAADGFRRGGVTDLSARYGEITWAQWVERQYGERARNSVVATTA
jgi:hypothetical protein